MAMRTIRAVMFAFAFGAVPALAEPLGQFTDHGDIGMPKHPGSATYDAAAGRYRVTGGGANMWADHDDFHFVWKKMSGDVSATTDLVFHSPSPAPGAPGYVHRKGGIVLRQDLDPDSVYVDALRMGNQQLSLQYREVKGGQTHLIWINTPHQGTVRLEKIGDYAYLSVPGPDGKLHHAGGSFKLKIKGPYYIGLGVCPHDNNVTETVDFTNVRFAAPTYGGRAAESTLQTMGVDNEWEQTAVVNVEGAIDAPAWSADGKSFTYGHGGRRYSVPADGMEIAAPVQTGPGAAKTMARNSGVSPDGQWVYFSAATDGQRKLWRAHPDGSGRTQVTSGSTRDWEPRVSPDGKWLVYLAYGASAPVDRMTRSDVEVRLAPITGGTPDESRMRVMAKPFGGPGTLDFDPWSPDGKNFAFVSARPPGP
ncbi:MAG TPA: hypothetical protein VHC40_02755 [Rhizomicrobium sp.]|nr:hypothetical protein [Rhizomicrobium sp.]